VPAADREKQESRPSMKIVERYIFSRAFTMFIATLAVTLAIVWTTQVLTRINLVTDSGQSAATFLYIATLMLPTVAPEVIPFAVVIAVAHTLATMNSDSELVVINAAGSSRLITIRPLMLLALGAGLFFFLVQNVIDPQARLAFRHGLAAAHADLLSSVIQEGTFRRIEQGLYVQVGERLPGGLLGGVIVADSRQPGTDLVYYAKEGRVKDDAGNALVMTDGVVHRKTADGRVSIIRFDSYLFDLSIFSPSNTDLFLGPIDRTLPYLINPDPADRIYQHEPQKFRAILHRRLTDWLYPIVFGLVALAVAGDARSHRQARLHPLITAMFITLALRWLAFFVAGEAETRPAFLAGIYLIPIVASMVAIWFIATHRTMELPMSAAERALEFFRRVAGAIMPRRRTTAARGA
jgi:lipopolysaccharide export system permease protein